MTRKMDEKKYNEAHKKALDSFLLESPLVQPGKMFGYPGYYVRGKLFACLYEDGVGLKVPEPLALKLLEKENIIPFQPLGRRKMKEWIQINHATSKHYLQDIDIFKTSIEYVSSLSNRASKKNKE